MQESVDVEEIQTNPVSQWCVQSLNVSGDLLEESLRWELIRRNQLLNLIDLLLNSVQQLLLASAQSRSDVLNDLFELGVQRGQLLVDVLKVHELRVELLCLIDDRGELLWQLLLKLLSILLRLLQELLGLLLERIDKVLLELLIRIGYRIAISLKFIYKFIIV